MIHLYKLLILLDNKLFNGGDEIRIEMLLQTLIKYFMVNKNQLKNGF
jgi:hypothetical protein